MKDKLIFSILCVIAISTFTFGVTYAYYATSVIDENKVTGEAEKGLSTTLTLQEYTDYTNSSYSTKLLVPLKDDLVQTAISKETDKCIDKTAYKVCKLYTITLNNTSTSEDLYGYIKTSTTTYEVNENTDTINLKYQIFNSSFNPLTDIMTPSNTTTGIVHFQYNGSNYPIISNGTATYYLVFWLTDTGSEQSDDYSKTFSGSVGFESVQHYGTGLDRIEATFTT